MPGARRRSCDPPTGSSGDDEEITAIKERIDEIKRKLHEKTSIMRVWGLLADLHALKAMMKSRASENALNSRDTSLDAIDESMGEYIVGYKHYQAGSLGEAEMHLMESINRLGWNVLARITLGNLLFIKGEHDRAAIAFEAALQCCEGKALSEVITNLSMNAFKAGDISNAE
ncbi:MAG: tetratricopeptide repeat protein [Candidatus Sigynarchaeota archaeon]